jgi:hypothetical protein
MPISRRGFLGYAAGASVAGLAGAAGFAGTVPSPSSRQMGCLLVGPEHGYPLRESVKGYTTALSSSHIAFQRPTFPPPSFIRTIIVPSAITAGAGGLAKLREHVENGCTVLFDSGAAFLTPKEFGFHKRFIRSVFGLGLHDPVQLWDSSDSLKQSPYVDYHWPVVSKIRDFSRAVPVDPATGEIIAWFRDLPVAAKRRIGKGTFVYLGSPLGPHLLSDDREAGHWLRSFCAAS